LNECSNVTVVPKAISDRRGYAKLKIPKTAEKRFIPGRSSIVWDYKEAFEVEVETDTLDSVLEEVGVDSIDILKIDVEGAEGLVVRGLRKH
jgi:FkbM family methyltransferase